MGFIGTGVRDVLLSPTTRAHDPEASALVLDCLRGMNRAALTNAIVSISLRRPDLTSQLTQIRCPTLFVTGSDHAGWTPEQAHAASGSKANGGRLELGVSASTAARVPNGSLRRWSINRCLAVTAAHKARSMRGKPIELSDEGSQRNRDSFAGTRAQVRLGAGHRSSRLIT